MSYILDALKKAAEQRDAHAPAMRRLFSPAPELPESPRWRLALVGGAAAVAGAVVAMWVFWPAPAIITEKTAASSPARLQSGTPRIHAEPSANVQPLPTPSEGTAPKPSTAVKAAERQPPPVPAVQARQAAVDSAPEPLVPTRQAPRDSMPAKTRQTAVDPVPAAARQATAEPVPAQGRQTAVDSVPAQGRQAAVDSVPAPTRQGAVDSVPAPTAQTPRPAPVESAPIRPQPPTPSPVTAGIRPAPGATPPSAVTPPRADGGGQMRLEVIVYSEERARRLAFINGRKYVEGDVLLDGSTIQEIQPNAVVIIDDGRRVVLKP